MIPKISLSTGKITGFFFPTGNQAKARRCPNVIWISKLAPKEHHTWNSIPLSGLFFQLLMGILLAESKELHTVRQESVKLFEKAEYPSVQIKPTGSTRATMPLKCPTHSLLPHWCLSYVVGNNYQLMTNIFIPNLN